jgi:hypothetical protein
MSDETTSVPMYDANLRIMAHMLGGIVEFATRLAKDGRITPGEVEDLAQKLTLPHADGESAMLAELREKWGYWIADMLAGVRVLAQEAGREQS